MKAVCNPKVSVVLPVYNCEQFIEASVRSILGQSFTDFELILVNDGSTDSTPCILEKLAQLDDRLVLLHQSNQGLVQSLNNGMMCARGGYIARMDADDISMPDRFFLQIEYLEKNMEVGIVGGQALVQDEAGNIIGKINRPVSHDAAAIFLRYGCPLVHPTYMVRSIVYKTLGGYREVPGAEDLDFLTRAALHGYRLSNVDACVLIYTRNLAGISSRLALQQMRNTRILLDNYRKNRVVDIAVFSFSSADERRLSQFSRVWFDFFYMLVSNLAVQERKRLGVDQFLRLLFFSLMHYELFFSLSRTIKRRCKFSRECK